MNVPRRSRLPMVRERASLHLTHLRHPSRKQDRARPLIDAASLARFPVRTLIEINQGVA